MLLLRMMFNAFVLLFISLVLHLYFVAYVCLRRWDDVYYLVCGFVVTIIISGIVNVVIFTVDVVIIGIMMSGTCIVVI